jgi:hypothetical protein
VACPGLPRGTTWAMSDWEELSRAQELRARLDDSRRELEQMSEHLTEVQAKADRLGAEQEPPEEEKGRFKRFRRRERVRKVRDAVQRNLG